MRCTPDSIPNFSILQCLGELALAEENQAGAFRPVSGRYCGCLDVGAEHALDNLTDAHKLLQISRLAEIGRGTESSGLGAVRR